MGSAPNGALYLRRSLRVAASGGAAEATGERAGEHSAADASLRGANIKNQSIYGLAAQVSISASSRPYFVTAGYLSHLTTRPTSRPAPRTDGRLPSHGRLAALPPSGSTPTTEPRI